MELTDHDRVGCAAGARIPNCIYCGMPWGDEPWDEMFEGMTCLCGSTIYYHDDAPFPRNIVDADARWLR